MDGVDGVFVVSDDNAKLLCVICHKEFPAGTTGLCPDDKGELERDALVGTIFAEKYEIQSLLGEGGMSRVYRARHTLMNRVVAIKLLHDCAIDSVAKARFQQEAEAASALSHPNVVTVHDFGLTPEGQAFFIMDCLEGKSLGDILDKEKCLSIQYAVEVFTQACDGLDHAHRKGIIHRDVKPSNLVIEKQEDGYDLVKLVDFGIAKLVSPNGSKRPKSQRITQTGEVFGTPAYMSPEQCNGGTLDARSDIYSFGCLMYEALAGEPPLYGDTFVATVMKQVNEIPVPLSLKALVKVPPLLETVIMKCLEKDPDKRYNSAAELKQALLDAGFASGLKGLRVGAVPEPRLMGVSGSSATPRILLTGETSRRLRRRDLITNSAVATVFLVAGSWLLFCFPGSEGDFGTFYDKIRWQTGIARSEELIREQKYVQAVSVLQGSVELAKNFKDDNRRLEVALTKLVVAYAGIHDNEKLEEVNNQLISLSDNRAYVEFDNLMALLKKWEEPSQSSVLWEERAQQASAFGERIARCADKLSICSRQKQEALLKRAAHGYDLLNMREGIFRARFRIQLAEIYKSQQRFDEQQSILEEAIEHAAKSPQTVVGWRYKIMADLMLGELSCNNQKMDKARQYLDNALAWTRAHLADDRDLLRSCLEASAHMYRALPEKGHDEKAAALMQEAKSIGAKLDADSAKF